jgi:hypothetical protein
MFPPDQLRIWAADLRACAARCATKDHMEEALLQATQYEELASSTEQFLLALIKVDTSPPWDWRAKTTSVPMARAPQT